MNARTDNSKWYLAVVAAYLVLLLTPAISAAVTLTTDNWRFVNLGGGGLNGNEQLYAYGNTEDTFIHFNITPYLGSTASGNGTLTMYISQSNPNKTVNVFQVNQYNANIDLDDADSNYKDTSALIPWKDNSNANLPTGADAAKITKVTTGQIATTVVGPGSVGTPFTWTILQADLQSWLNGTLPPTIVISGYNLGGGGQFFYDGTGQLPNLAFTVEAAVPEPSTYALGLIGLAGLGLVVWRKRPARG